MKKFWKISPKSCQNYHFSPIKTTVNVPDISSEISSFATTVLKPDTRRLEAVRTAD